MSEVKITAIEVKTEKRNEFKDVTSRIEEVVRKEGVSNGMVVLYVPHTTAGVTINENYDPSVREDIINKLSELIPPNAGYAHSEGNADSHIKSTMVGCSEYVPVDKGRLGLGRWQGIFFCEFDGPRTRRLVIEIIS